MQAHCLRVLLDQEVLLSSLVLLGSVEDDLVNFDRHKLQQLLLFYELLRDEGLAVSDAFGADLLLFKVMALALGVASREIEPGVERDVVVHLKQEGVNRLTITNHLGEELLVDLYFQ